MMHGIDAVNRQQLIVAQVRAERCRSRRAEGKILLSVRYLSKVSTEMNFQLSY
jgi:hypothetical protein